MEKLSVKKPFTILVAAIIIIALGGVSLSNLQMDLLPEISLPYLIVVTAYPGASPEKVEDQVTAPLENSLGTISGVENVSSTSAENYSMVQLEFADGTDMNTAMVKVSSALNQIESSLPDGVSTPNIMEISMDMLATMYVAVEREDYDIYELSDFVDNDVIPYISREEGVASISTIGLVEQSVLVELNQDKIDKLNDKILEKTDEKLQDAQKQLTEAKDKLDEAQKELEKQQSKFGTQVSSAIFKKLDQQAPGLAKKIKQGIKSLRGRIKQLRDSLKDEPDKAEQAVDKAQKKVDKKKKVLDAAKKELTKAETALTTAKDNQAAAQKAMDDYKADPSYDPDSEEYKKLDEDLKAANKALKKAQTAYDEAEAAYKKAKKSYNSAVDKLTEANLYAAGMSKERVTQIVKLMDQVIDMLDQAGAEVDGSSFNKLISTTRHIYSAISNVITIIQTLDQANLPARLDKLLKQANKSLSSLSGTVDSLPSMLKGLETMVSGLTQGQLDAAVGFATAATTLSSAQAQLDAAQKQYDTAKETALENANADALISPKTLSQLVYAQNFEMPIGYIDDKNDNSWLLRVGEEFNSSEQIASALLLDNETIGVVRLSDIADITVIDNANDSLSKLNRSDSIILCIYKSSSSGTNDVSKACNKALEELEEKYPGTNFVNVMDQGDYIRMIVESVLQSMIIGAILAIIVLAIFLGDFKPTIVVAISIPLSVLFAIVLMYFAGLELNVMTLSGLSLGIGMLVDNSVVVMENIFRLRGQGLPAPRAAVQGAKQVRGAIIASTLTTVCVFLPAVFASGTVRSLMYPMAMSIGFCLVGSLAIALTVVPASSSTLMRKSKPKNHKIFDKIQDGYGKSLQFCLKFKFLPLLLAIGLLAFSVWQVFRMGIVYIPEMITNEIQINVKTPEEMTKEESYAEVEQIIDKLLSVEGVENIGAMDSTSMTGFFGGALGSATSGSYGRYIVSVLLPEGASEDTVRSTAKTIEEQVAEFPGELEVQASQMMDTSALFGGSGFSVNIYGDDYKELERISKDIRKILEETEGIDEVTDAFTEGADTLQVLVDRDKAMKYGLTVAQIYAGILEHTSEKVTATTITVNGQQMKVEIVNNTEVVTKETLMDIEFDEVDMTGAAASASGMSGMSGMSGSSGVSIDFSSMTGDDKDKEKDKDKDEEKDKEEEKEEEESKTHKLSEFATVVETKSSNSLKRKNLSHFVTVSSTTKEGYNTTLISREIEPKLEEYSKTVPDGITVEVAGESSEVMEMVVQMVEMAALALLFVYLIMVAQFQSLLSPFIIMFTIPLAFTGGMIGLLIAGIPMSMLSLLGFVILMGTVVNNGIVYVDYANQLRIGGMERWDALIATGKTRMRPILMTALTTILAMSMMIFGSGMSTQLGRGMAVVIAGGLLYATFMTLYIVPVMYDILFKRPPLNVDTGSDLDVAIDDAAQYIAEMKAKKEAESAASSAKVEAPASVSPESSKLTIAGVEEGAPDDKKSNS